MQSHLVWNQSSQSRWKLAGDWTSWQAEGDVQSHLVCWEAVTLIELVAAGRISCSLLDMQFCDRLRVTCRATWCVGSPSGPQSRWQSARNSAL